MTDKRIGRRLALNFRKGVDKCQCDLQTFFRVLEVICIFAESYAFYRRNRVQLFDSANFCERRIVSFDVAT